MLLSTRRGACDPSPVSHLISDRYRRAYDDLGYLWVRGATDRGPDWQSHPSTLLFEPPAAKMRSRFFTRTAPPEVPEEVPEEVPAPGTEKALETNEKQPGAAAEGDVSDSDAISMNAQDGVRDIEAMTKVWSRSHLILAYIL